MDAKGRVLSEECIADEVPFELPEGWCWARLESFAAILNGDRGKNYPAKSKLRHNGIPFVSALNISNGIIVLENMLYMTGEQFSLLRAGFLNKGDTVFCIRGSLGKHGVFPFDKGAIASSLVIVRPYEMQLVYQQYLNILFDSSLTVLGIQRFNNGTAQPNLAARDFQSFVYPIPPLTEQRRIVEKVDELMPLVEEYGRLEDAREALDAGLSDRLRKSILQQAIQGRLAPQDPSDEPASALLERVRAERRRLVKEGKARFPKGGESVIYTGSDGGHYEKRLDAKGRVIGDAPIEDEIPFDIPEGWAWARLGSVSQIRGGATPDKSNSAYWNGTVNWASMKDIHGDFLLSTIDRITEEGLASKTSIGVCQPGELIVSSRLVPGKSIISKIVTAINQDLKIVQSDAFLVDYLHYWFQSQLDVFKRLGSGTTVPGIKLERLESSLIPTPSLAEQARIVDVLHGALPPLTNQ